MTVNLTKDNIDRLLKLMEVSNTEFASVTKAEQINFAEILGVPVREVNKFFYFANEEPENFMAIGTQSVDKGKYEAEYKKAMDEYSKATTPQAKAAAQAKKDAAKKKLDEVNAKIKAGNHSGEETPEGTESDSCGDGEKEFSADDYFATAAGKSSPSATTKKKSSSSREKYEAEIKEIQEDIKDLERKREEYEKAMRSNSKGHQPTWGNVIDLLDRYISSSYYIINILLKLKSSGR